MTYRLTSILPNAKGFCDLRAHTDWGAVSLNQASAALSASYCGVSLYYTQDGNDKDVQTVPQENLLPKAYPMQPEAPLPETPLPKAPLPEISPYNPETSGAEIFGAEPPKPALIGMARVIGDGVLNLYIQDVIIAKGYRSKGLGARVLAQIITDLQSVAPKECTIGLMAAKGQSAFYTRFGFTARPNDKADAGMSAALNTLSPCARPSQTRCIDI